MKVLLVDPHRESAYSCPSLGLMYIAAVLEENGVEVSITEMRFMKTPWVDLRKIVSERSPDVIGITSYSYTFPDAVKAARVAKGANPEVKIVFGGPHVTFTSRETLMKNPEIDIIVIGEGELTMLELVRAYESCEDLGKVRGVMFRKNGKVVRTPPRPFIRDLDKLPFPARHLVSMDKYREIENTTTMITSRGCPFKCVFCSSRAMWGPRVRLRSPKNVVDEMEQIAKNYDFNKIGFADDVFTLDKDRTVKICRELRRRGLNIRWECSTRTDLLSKKLLNEMKKAGCRAIFLGIESGCQEVLDRIGKGTTIEQSEKAMKWAREVGIETRLSFMLGCPGETQKTVSKTLRFAKKLGKLGGGTISFSLLKAYPGTELFEQPEKFGITFIDKNWGRKHGAPLIPTCETEGLSMQERYFIAWGAGEVECYWNAVRSRLVNKKHS